MSIQWNPKWTNVYERTIERRLKMRVSIKRTKKSLSKKSSWFFCCFLLALNLSLSATTIKVASIPALEKAIQDALPGDVIVLADGIYTTSQNIVIRKNGTKLKPIIIRAQSIAGAEIKGSGGFVIESPSTYIIIDGFRFSHDAERAKLSSGSSFCRWTHNVFETPGTGNYLTVSGSDHEISYNTYQNKNSVGKFIAIRGEGSQIAQRIWIHHNYFFNFPNQGGVNGAEALQFGLSGFSLSSSHSVVEHNLFEKCHGENELISVKASDVTLRFNTIRDCPAQFTLRHGNRCAVYGNYFINTPGIRIFGDDHVVHSNHFENCRLAINIGNGGAEVADGAPLVSHDRPDRVLVAFNTLVNNEHNIIQTARKNGIGSTFITVAYNIIQGGGPAAEIAGPYTGEVWKGNIIHNTNGAGEMPSTGYTSVDPMLVKDHSGAYHLRIGSPAIDTAKESFSTITIDMDGQARTPPLDAGADEFSDASTEAQILFPDLVGFNALKKK